MKRIDVATMAVALWRVGCRSPVSEHALSSLAAYASDFGLEEVLDWVRDDSGLTVIPTWQFWPVPAVMAFEKGDH